MSLANCKPAKAVLLVILTFSVASAAAIDLDVKDGEAWLNQDDKNKVEIEYDCQDANLKAGLKVGDQVFADDKTENGSISLEQLNEPTLDTGVQSTELKCYNETEDDELVEDFSKDIELKELDFIDISQGEGFVGGVIGSDRFTEPIEITLTVDGNGEVGDLDTGNFDLDKENDASVNRVISTEDSSGQRKATIMVSLDDDFPPTKESLKLRTSYADQDFTKDVPVLVHDWKATLAGDNNPGPKMDYSNLDEYVYNLNIENHGSSSGTLDNDEFLLTIREKTEDGYKVYEDESGSEYKDLEWLKWETPEGSPGNYQVSIDNIPDLPAGKYRFDLSIKYGESSDEEFKVDTLKVDRSMKFSGKVKDSTGRGVRTDMVMTTQDGRTIPVGAGSDGVYSSEINGETFDTMTLDFFDREKSSPDSSLVLDNVDLGRDSDLGTGSEAVGFQYWRNPGVNVEGLQAVNMMAVKFAYQINGGAQATMKFDTQNVNPRKLKVFECTEWNFVGTNCMGEWNQTDSEKVSVNLATNSVNINDLNLHTLSKDVTGSSAKDMLMNAYVVGVNEPMRLSGTVSFSGPEDGRVPTGNQVEASARILSSSGSPVEDAEVDIVLGEDAATLEGTTDSSGSFTATGKVPEDADEYTVTVEASHGTYQDFEQELSNSLEVYIKEEASLEIPSDIMSSGFEIQEGEERSFEFDVKNTGQRDVSSLQLSAETDMPSQFVELSEDSGFGTLEPGDSETAELSVELPSGYCDGICTDYPTIDIALSGESETGSSLSDSVTVQTQVSPEETGSSDTSESEESLTSPETENNDSSGGFSVDTPDLAETTGEFLASQSSLNVVLALVMLFMMVLAGAVKNQKGSGGNERRNKVNGQDMSRPDVKIPDVSSGTEEKEEVSSQKDDSEMEKAMEEVSEMDDEVEETSENDEVEEMAEKLEQSEDQEDQDSENEDEEVKCGVCGEEFDTEMARKLHEDAVHED